MMGTKDLEFWRVDGCSAEGSPGTTCLQTMTSHPRTKICDSAYFTMYRIPNDGDKRSGILDGRWVLCKGVTRTTFFQTITTCPKFVILKILQCIGYLVMGTKDQEFRRADGCSAEGSLGT